MGLEKGYLEQHCVLSPAGEWTFGLTGEGALQFVWDPPFSV